MSNVPNSDEKIQNGSYTYHSISPLQELRAMDVFMEMHELPMTARVVMYKLIRWTNGKKDHRYNGYSWASRETLAEVIGRDSPTTITTATKALKAMDLIIVKRRPNATSLIRPNWKKINQLAMSFDADPPETDPEDQEAVLPKDQKPVLPEDQKTGPYSADHYSADLDSADQVFTASGEAVETGSGSEDERPSGVPADDEHSKGMTAYVEALSQSEFIHMLDESMPAYAPFNEHRPQRDKDRASEQQFKKLMRLGWKRLEILQGVEAYLREYDRHDHSKEFYGNGKCGKTLGGLLADMVTQCNPEFRNMPNGEMFDGWCIPDRFLTMADKVKTSASNDNELSDIDIAI